ncbi:MAG: hypothetical protein AVDCRST_MAG32-2470 [uncultured Nocardioides sp.]|uniref:Uncharacterized protein n=1 Tax=uncultured Nocardioides sp. TaxID=198441 RepID=A0A6J4NQQ7_9ACTN|nr:MAG: hypothetical protein AVDCRST_MAG32-2470 [uncultured Nocardioides sp.]
MGPERPARQDGAGADPLTGVGRRRRAGSGSGTADARAARARELHRKAAEADALAARSRAERDRLMLQLRAEDPRRWSYSALAQAIGCSRELVALVVRRQR